MDRTTRPLREVVAFLGTATIVSMVGVWTPGLAMFALELAFAFLLQRALISAGLAAALFVMNQLHCARARADRALPLPVLSTLTAAGRRRLIAQSSGVYVP